MFGGLENIGFNTQTKKTEHNSYTRTNTKEKVRKCHTQLKLNTAVYGYTIYICGVGGA